MNSIPPNTLFEIANTAAVESRRPWRVEQLQVKALEAYRMATRHAASSGLSHEQASERVRRRIYAQVLKAGGEIDALPPGQSKPTPEQIETALEAFTVEQWTPVEQWPPLALSPPMEGWPIVEYRYGLMESVGRAEVEALLAHIRGDKGDLKRRIGAGKLGDIEGAAIMRHIELTLPEERSKLVPISDAYWADFWPELAREANREGRGHPAKGRSVDEQSSDRSIAKHLTKRDVQTGREMKVSAYQVKTWRERRERVPLEKFDGDLIEYLTLIHNTAAFDKYLSAHEN